MTSPTIPVEEFRRALETGNALAVDVREPDEFRHERIANTVNHPLSRLDRTLNTLPRDRDLYVFCQTGIRTARAVEVLSQAGFARIRFVDGGVDAWKNAGYPTMKSGGPLPIQRQVQIVAGGLVVLGLATGQRWLSFLIGAGLLFSGLSGTCALAALLAKLPGNRPRA
ncbi:MAG: rhodanese-like domain-containing protein [Elusimicrobia bacterium]|nr:rhodanese-like domain-containing protein [Elusimicrobiota bacterium]